ncbi:hypothetical protein Poli38472_013929 [Pythium oligandrum]|uniref:Ankyrin repeat protein n=1 Tax=Pythium oligandrum TaxID=41045 RepID=A0A8K1C2X1_PYTOL|nr:hypothetical protein Poli38472_013929 [Pythium oligandrum]|eukprot:TMW55167.1 hypothetical protein Poli38472_013929 [Pythium oligandrum]
MFRVFKKEEKPVIVANGEDPELEEFLRKEAEEEEQRKQKRRRRQGNGDDEPKLFMQLSWAEQRRAGTNAPVLRQVEGDSINQRIRVYRRSLFFQIHSKLDHNAYVLTQLRLNKQDPNGKDEKGRTALHYACRYGAEIAVRTLVYEEATIDDPDLEMRWTPLHYAVMGGHDRIVERLLEKAPVRRITINRKDKHGVTPLMLVLMVPVPRVLFSLFHPMMVFALGVWRGSSSHRKAPASQESVRRRNRSAANDSALVAEVLVQYDANLKSKTYTTNETALEMAERLRSHLVAILLYEVIYRKA